MKVSFINWFCRHDWHLHLLPSVEISGYCYDDEQDSWEYSCYISWFFFTLMFYFCTTKKRISNASEWLTFIALFIAFFAAVYLNCQLYG